MREQVRNMDRALSNIESMPGGFNALAQFHSSMQVGVLALGVQRRHLVGPSSCRVWKQDEALP